MKDDQEYRYLERMGELNVTAIEVNESICDVYTIIEEYLKEYIPEDRSSILEMWRLREQARMMVEKVILLDMINRYG